jgi:heptaprenyl diphosphate synthase
VRPRLVEMLGRAVGAPPSALVDVAVAAELIHSGSLLHDDVIDEGRVRRGRPTANARWGNTAAVLAGDLCLTRAFVQLHPHPRILMTEAVDTIAAMARAAMLEAEARGRLDLGDEPWRDMVEGKTGALFAWCGRSAARLADDADAVDRFTRFGMHLGVAFQLADDCRDLVGGSKKDRFSDIRNREPSYPILRAVAEAESLHRRVERAWAQEQVHPEVAAALGEAILKTDVVEHTIGCIRAEVDEAIDALGDHASAPGCSEAVWWARGLVRRARGE